MYGHSVLKFEELDPLCHMDFYKVNRYPYLRGFWQSLQFEEKC